MARSTLRRLAALLLLAAGLTACGAEARAPGLVFDGRFPSAGGRGAWDRVYITEPGSDDRPVYQTRVRRRDQGAAVLLDVGGDPLAERIEHHKDLSTSVAEGTEYWIAFSLMIPRGPPDPFASGRETYFQLVSKFNTPQWCDYSRGAASTRLEIGQVRGRNQWQWFQTGGKGDCRLTTSLLSGIPVVTDRWYDFLVHVRIGSVAADRPLTELLWRNGRPDTEWRTALRSSAPNLVRSAAYPGTIRIQHGLYKTQGPARSRVYEGGLVVARSRSDAESAAFG